MAAILLRIATRESPLALWQANYVAALLRKSGGVSGDVTGDVKVELVPMTTSGDERANEPISSLGGKGVFVKEVQAAVLDGRADLAVHSAKDLPSETVEGLALVAVPERGDPRDALVGSQLDDLPDGAVVATGSNRRRVQLAALRPDLVFSELRGNIATRLRKAEGFNAIVMAAVALERLDIVPDELHVLSAEQMIPQVGQGALAIEVRADDPNRHVVAALDHGPSRRCVDAERAFLAELGGDCTMPAGAYATLDGDAIFLNAVLSADSTADRIERCSVRESDPSEAGRSAARLLRARLQM